MASAVIGYTGFVGSNINRQHDFDDHYDTSNIAEIDGKEYDLVVSAGARADKWLINQEPEVDLAQVDRLISHLKTIKAKQFVLISTTDVYKTPVDVDEDTPIETDGLHGYGLNRYHLEQFCRKQFDALIIRLPGLFGQGLKKNVIFDLLHDNNVDRIHHAGEFQYYNLDNIWKDIQIVVDNHLKLVNFATEPVRTDEIAKVAFGMDFTNEPEGMAAGRYDMHSKYAELFGGHGFYMYSKQQELHDIKQFVKSQKA
jgi:NAD-dependent epimerase/dehydratase family protein